MQGQPSNSMDGESLPHRSHEARFQIPVPGMESVVATVSGYHGIERFNLIKMISRSGGNYVGNMSGAITHLVCWKFEGKKYELAKKFNTIVVNHRWIEDCIKKGKRVLEHAYTDRCGEVIGPLLLDISLIAEQPDNQLNVRRDSKEQAIDVEFEDSACVYWTDSILLNQDPVPQQSQSKHRKKRKASTSSSRQTLLFDSGFCFEDIPSHGSIRTEQEELNIPDTVLLTKSKERNRARGKPSRRGCRLLKGVGNTENLEFNPDEERESHQAEIFYELCDHIDTAIPDAERRGSILGSPHPAIAMDNIEQIEDPNTLLDFDQNLPTDGPSSSIKNMQENCSSTDGNLNKNEHITSSSKSTELSCIICLEDFCSTRGFLECGHRFCFSCIESWSYEKRSEGKTPTCPLCIAPFEKITRVGDAVASDQKVYSQTIPLDYSGVEIYILPDAVTPVFAANTSTRSICCKCLCSEPEEMLERCHLCEACSVHIYCLDPPLFPWTCDNCKDLQMLHRHSR